MTKQGITKPSPIAHPRLTIEMIPRATYGINLRSKLTKPQWDTLRRTCYKRADYRCEICGGVGPAHPVECHEVWEYFYGTYEQRLVGLQALCPLCHKVKHIGRTLASEGPQTRQEIVYHMRRVNNWTMRQLEDYYVQYDRKYREFAEAPWRVNIDWALHQLVPFRGKIDKLLHQLPRLKLRKSSS